MFFIGSHSPSVTVLDSPTAQSPSVAALEKVLHEVEDRATVLRYRISADQNFLAVAEREIASISSAISVARKHAVSLGRGKDRDD